MVAPPFYNMYYGIPTATINVIQFKLIKCSVTIYSVEGVVTRMSNHDIAQYLIFTRFLQKVS